VIGGEGRGREGEEKDRDTSEIRDIKE